MKWTQKIVLWLTVLGPGLLVMLADTDAGSLIVAAQSGAQWGYKLLPIQLILIPVLFMTQELSVRLGLVTGMGQGELIRAHFGKFWAYFAIILLTICCIGALLTEFSGLAAVGLLFHVAAWKTMAIVVAFLIIIAWSGSYTSVERVAIFLGVFELIFIWVAWQAHPSLQDILQQTKSIPWQNTGFLYLISGNIGAVIMPWMIFFQQSAILDKGLNINHLKPARWDTLIGAVITQLIMMALLVTTAATIGKINPNTPLDTIMEISTALTAVLGSTTGRVLFALGMAGASLVATIVVSLTAAWAVGEVLGVRRSLEDHPREAPWFYGIYTLALILSAALISSNVINLVSLSIAIEVMNALVLPLVLVFLFLLAYRALPEPYRLKGGYAVCVGVTFAATATLGVVAGLWGIF